MSIFKNKYNPFAVMPTEFPTDENLPQIILNTDFSDFSEYNVQDTADTENDFPAIAHGYPIIGFNRIKNNRIF